MPLDRFVYFDDRPAPLNEALKTLLDRYLSGVGRVEWCVGRWFATLPGAPCDARGRLEPEDMPRARWFEVYRHDDSVDVITRDGDQYTEAVAVGFARLVALEWAGRLEES